MCLKNDRDDLTRHWARREEKLLRERSRIPKHGKGFAVLYTRVIAKRDKVISEKSIRSGRKIRERERSQTLSAWLRTIQEE